MGIGKCIPTLQEQGSKVRVRTVLINIHSWDIGLPQRRRGGISVPRECLLVKVLRPAVVPPLGRSHKGRAPLRRYRGISVGPRPR